MELKVWVEGIQRIICGVTETTTCQDVVFALAHATGKSGRFTLSERWRNNERQLTPDEKPLKILMKWGEYSNDVQFVLQWSESNKCQGSSKHKFLLPLSLSNSASGSSSRTGSIERSKDKRDKQKSSSASVSPPFKSPKSPTSPLSPLSPNSPSSDVTPSSTTPTPTTTTSSSAPTSTSTTTSTTNIGVVRGIPSQANPQHPRQNTSPLRESPKHIQQEQVHQQTQQQPQEHRQQLQELRNSVYRMEVQQEQSHQPTMQQNQQMQPQLQTVMQQNQYCSPSPSSSSSPMMSGGSVHSQSSQQQRVAPPYKDPPAPPPYRDPPRPNSCNLLAMQSQQTVGPQQQQQQQYRRSVHQDHKLLNEDSKSKFQRIEEPVIYNTQYRELVNLVNFQREKLSSQQADLTKYDAEILYWESKEREKQFQLDFINQEMVTLSNASRITSEQLQSLSHAEEENEIVKQQEKTLKSELTLLRSKLANCETELLQCKNKIRLVMDEMQLEQRTHMRRSESRKQIERNLYAEMERLQRDVELAKQNTELHHLTADTLKKEVAALEVAITEKKRQVEQLVGEMKAANLQSLTVAGAAEEAAGGVHYQMAPVDAMVGGGMHNRSGSTRKMIGSPRQLENAAPTSKNPHGVWV